MRFIVFLLALAAALTAVGTLLIGMMTIFADNPHDPKIAWGYVVIGSAAAAIAACIVAGFAVWVRPGVAAALLWLAAASGVVGMAAQGVIMFLVRNQPNAPDAYNVATAISASGAIPALGATVAALLVQFVVLPRRNP